MDISNILEELRRERDRIIDAIAALERMGSRTRRGRRPAAAAGKPRRKRKLTPEGRKRLSDMMKKRWAERRRRGKAA